MKFIFLIGFLFFHFQLTSQENYVIANAAMAEKIYLQLDGNIYTKGQTIWFKAIVVNAATHFPTELSRVLYVELIAPDKKIVEKKLVEIENGTGDNFFELYEDYPEGTYLVRAYTEWNKNFNSNFIFSTYINVFPSSHQEQRKIFSSINLFDKGNGDFGLEAQVNPQFISDKERDGIKVFLNFDGQEDSLVLKRNTDNKYRFDYQLLQKPTWATLTLETEKGIKYTTTMPFNTNAINLQFFPESGKLIHGLTNLMGFKAVDNVGNGIPVEGEIINENNKVVASFKSNHLGMGRFFLRPDSTSTYSGKITMPENSGRFSLPQVTKKGSILSIIKRKNKINITVSSNHLKNDSLFIDISSRGIAHGSIKGKLKEGRLVSSLSAQELPEGIIVFTLKNGKSQPIAERLFFNERPEERLNIELATDKKIYSQREKINIIAKASGEKDTLQKISLSLLVISNKELGTIHHNRQNILSYLLLDSELKGKIENPGTYFREENKNRFNDLDALILTQGWRNYKYTLPPEENLRFEPELSLSVSGTVGGVFFEKNRKKNVELSLMTFGENPVMSTQSTDSLGRFYFPLNDFYGNKLDIVIQSSNENGRNKDYSISLRDQKSPQIIYDQTEALRNDNVQIKHLVKKFQKKKGIEDSYSDLSAGTEKLDEVVVEAYEMTPQRKKVMENYGKPDKVIEGKKIREMEQNWSYGLFSVLRSNFPKDIRMKRTGGQGGYLLAEVIGGDTTLVVIDGIPVREYDYNLIPNIPPSEVKSVEIIKFADHFATLNREVHPDYSNVTPPSGSIIAIYTHSGNGILGTNKPKGIFQTSVPIFSPHREYYTPHYENDSSFSNSSLPDLREVIFWEPQVEADPKGTYSTSYYNADTTGEMLIVVEAITSDGNIGYQELKYEIKEEK